MLGPCCGRGRKWACFAGDWAASTLAATTQGPISAVVLMMELTGHDRSFIAPLLLAVVGATLVRAGHRTAIHLRCASQRRTGECAAKSQRARDVLILSLLGTISGPSRRARAKTARY